LAQLSSLAYRHRSSESATEAWWVKVPFSEADRLLGHEPRSPGAVPGPTTQTYVIILKGDYTGGDGRPYKWAVLVHYANGKSSGQTVYVTNDRPDTRGQAWTPLPLASP
jgi:hypothetical protein